MDTAQLRADFDRDGYVVCRGALAGHDFAPLRRLIERQVEGQAERLADVRGDAFDAHEQAPFETRWAELAREFAADPTVPEDRRALVNATWGGMDMLDEATHALYTCPACKTIAQTLLGPEVQANGDCKWSSSLLHLLRSFALTEAAAQSGSAPPSRRTSESIGATSSTRTVSTTARPQSSSRSRRRPAQSVRCSHSGSRW